jgi:hypothetical protein
MHSWCLAYAASPITQEFERFWAPLVKASAVGKDVLNLCLLLRTHVAQIPNTHWRMDSMSIWRGSLCRQLAREGIAALVGNCGISSAACIRPLTV